MYDLVTKEGHNERPNGDNKHASEAWDIRIDGIDQLSYMQLDEGTCALRRSPALTTNNRVD